jgi:glutaredoxin
MKRAAVFLLALAAATVAAEAPAPASPPQGAAITQSAQVPVVMYATAWCPYCAKARAYFKQTNTAFVEHDIEGSATAHAEYKRLGGRGVPLILIGNEKLHGFSELAFEAAYARAERAQ